MNNIKKLTVVLDQDMNYKKILFDGVELAYDCKVTADFTQDLASITIKADTVEVIRE